MMPQMPSREKLLAWIDQVSFAVVEMNLYLDTHPEDEDALAFFREKVELRKEALKQYAEQYGPLTIDTANDRMSRDRKSTRLNSSHPSSSRMPSSA